MGHGRLGDGAERVEEAATANEAVGRVVGHAGVRTQPGGDGHRTVGRPFATVLHVTQREGQDRCPAFVFCERSEQLGGGEQKLLGRVVDYTHVI